MPITVPLKYGLAAEVVETDTERPAYVPRPLDREEHDLKTCPCGACRILRDWEQTGTEGVKRADR